MGISTIKHVFIRKSCSLLFCHFSIGSATFLLAREHLQTATKCKINEMNAQAIEKEDAADNETTKINVFEHPFFFIIHGYLDVKSALRLRSTSRTARNICFSDIRLAQWRVGTVLQEAIAKRTLKPPIHDIGDRFPCVDDVHIGWLISYPPASSTTQRLVETEEVVDFEYPTDVEIDLKEAPLITDVSLRRIAVGPYGENLKSFSVERGRDCLRSGFLLKLDNLTTNGAIALVQSSLSLERLCLSWCEYVDGTALCAAIVNELFCSRTLRYLILDGVPNLTDRTMVLLAACTELRLLKMRDTTATDLSPLAACDKLEELHVCRGWRVEPRGVVVACTGFKSSINLLCCGGCRLIDLDAALQVLRMCPPPILTF